MVELSVIIPAYNAESTITRAVRSVLRDVPEGSEVLVLTTGAPMPRQHASGASTIRHCGFSSNRMRAWPHH